MNAKSLALAAALALAAPAAHAGGNLYIYNWTDYTSPELIKKFEAETGVKVSIDTYDSNETLLAKLKSGSAGYDIVVASSDFVPIFISQGLIQKVDADTWPGYKNIDARWRGPAWDPGNHYTVPYGWGVTGYAINTKHVAKGDGSLATLFDPPASAKGKVGMLGAPTEVVSMAEILLGLPPCQTDVAAMKTVSALLEKQAPSVEVYASDGIIERLASGETWIQQTWNGDAARARAANPDIAFVFPKEGAVAWMDNIAVPTGAKDPENAKLFMQFMLRPENAGLSANFTHYTTPIAGADAFYDKAMRESPELKVPADLKMSFTPACPIDAIKLIDRVWTRLKR